MFHRKTSVCWTQWLRVATRLTESEANIELQQLQARIEELNQGPHGSPREQMIIKYTMRWKWQTVLKAWRALRAFLDDKEMREAKLNQHALKYWKRRKRNRWAIWKNKAKERVRAVLMLAKGKKKIAKPVLRRFLMEMVKFHKYCKQQKKNLMGMIFKWAHHVSIYFRHWETKVHHARLVEQRKAEYEQARNLEGDDDVHLMLAE